MKLRIRKRSTPRAILESVSADKEEEEEEEEQEEEGKEGRSVVDADEVMVAVSV